MSNVDKLEVLAEQMLDSAIVGGIAAFAAIPQGQAWSWATFAIAFSMTFLIKLKEYRAIK